jgi:hypothetical protein
MIKTPRKPLLRSSLRAPLARFALLGLSMLPGLDAYARPDWVRLSYSQCIACHTQSLGGGRLTGYGKEILRSSSWLSSIASSTQSNTDSTLEQQDEARWALYASARGTLLTSAKRTEFFLMQADLGARWSASRWSAETTLGFQATRDRSVERGGSGIFGRYVLLRQAVINRKIFDWELSFGRDQLGLGTQTDDHTRFIRTQWRKSVTDYPTQLKAAYLPESWSLGLALFAPSFEETSSDQEYGVAARAERPMADSFVLGAFGLFGRTVSIQRLGTGVFGRYGLSSSAAILFEINSLSRSFPLQPESSTSQQWVASFEPSWSPKEWLDAYGVL